MRYFRVMSEMIPPVVFVNGLGAPHLLARLYATRFRTRGFRVFPVTPSFLGFGDIPAAARRVGEKVVEVRARTGARRVNLVGMSLGGLIGLYYLRCLGGEEHISRFVSVGGPLNGSRLACMARRLPLAGQSSIAQVCTASEVVRDIQRRRAGDNGTRMYTVGTRGDVVTPRTHWNAAGLVPVETPHGIFPLGHWCLFLLPGNHRVVEELLREG
jgi:pimeloyl-ACP methyl ester carboxylesterase